MEDLIKMRDELGWADQRDKDQIILSLVTSVMTCLERIDALERNSPTSGEAVIYGEGMK